MTIDFVVGLIDSLAKTIDTIG